MIAEAEGAKARKLGERGERVPPEQEPLDFKQHQGRENGARVDDRGDGGGGNATSVEGEPSPGTANVSMVDTISEMTDDGKARDRSNATTVGDKPAGSPLPDLSRLPISPRSLST